MYINGKIELIEDSLKISKNLTRRSLVVVQNQESKCPNYLNFTLDNDLAVLADNYKVGDDVTVWFKLQGKKWDGPQGIKYFNSLFVYKISLQIKEI